MLAFKMSKKIVPRAEGDVFRCLDRPTVQIPKDVQFTIIYREKGKVFTLGKFFALKI